MMTITMVKVDDRKRRGRKPCRRFHGKSKSILLQMFSVTKEDTFAVFSRDNIFIETSKRREEQETKQREKHSRITPRVISFATFVCFQSVRQTVSLCVQRDTLVFLVVVHVSVSFYSLSLTRSVNQSQERLLKNRMKGRVTFQRFCNEFTSCVMTGEKREM